MDFASGPPVRQNATSWNCDATGSRTQRLSPAWPDGRRRSERRRVLDLFDPSCLVADGSVNLKEADRIQQVGTPRCCSLAVTLLLPALILPTVVAAQGSPFLTGAVALQNNILAWLTPIAVILVMALGAMA